MGRLIGYARVSTAEQDLSLQLEALRGAGCRAEQIFLVLRISQATFYRYVALGKRAGGLWSGVTVIHC